MQGKGLVKFAAIVLIIVCAYQLLFTWKASSIEKKAKAHAESIVPQEDVTTLFPNNTARQFTYTDSLNYARKEIKNRYLDSLSTEKVMNLLFAKYTYKDCKERQLNLGLDLQGGMSVVLQVSLKELLQSMSDYSRDRTFNEALERAEKNQASSNDDYITLFAKAFKELNPNGRLAPIFATRDYQDRIPFSASDDEVIAVINEEAQSAIKRTFNIIRSRIDQFGVTQPNITLEPNKGRIIVELAGVDNPARVRKLLQATASLEFWETYKVTEIGNYLNDANTAIREHIEIEAALNDTTNEATISLDGNDDGEEEDTPSLLSGEEEDTSDLLSNLGDDNDSDSTEYTFEDFSKENPLFAVLQPNVDNNNRYQESPIIGYARARDTSAINSYFNLPKVKDIFPRELSFNWAAKPFDEDNPFFALYAIKKLVNDDKPPLDGSVITSAKQDIDQNGEVVVDMKMNPEGARIWKKLTGENIDNHIAIVLDNLVYSAPVVNSEIGGGSSQISGGFTIQEAQDLSNILKTGKLPARAEIIEEEIVGPSLGQESINAGFKSLLFGLLLVIGFMVLYYSSAGIVADLVLLLNLFFIIGVLASLGATLTLPGYGRYRFNDRYGG